MKWIDKFQFFLFDFDGLLVNTEHIHFQAYINCLAKLGVKLDWNFSKYCSIAHTSAKAIEENLRVEYPQLFENGMSWKEIYEIKKQECLNLFATGKIELMDGVEILLKALEKQNIKRCVVTNSTKEQVRLIRHSLPVLETLPFWITREQYIEPKPHPECYLNAIEKYGKKGDQIIGFEDSLRGLNALLKTPALPVLICEENHPHIESVCGMSEVFYFPSFSSIDEKSFG